MEVPARTPPGRIFQTFGRTTRRVKFPYHPPLGRGILRGVPAFIMLALLAALFPTSLLPTTRPSLCCNDGWGMRATHPSPPPSPHQSRNLPASKRALKALQRMVTTLNHQDARLGSP